MTAIAAPTQTVPAEDLGRVHFIGVGGAGMSGIARIMLARGMKVSGSDAKDSVHLAALRALGALVHVGHDAAQLGEADTVVLSSAIRERNPELIAARERGLLVLPRASALASLMTGRRSIAVAGTHGKTTTTSLLTVALQRCGADPSFAIGGHLNESGANAHHGTGDTFVAEADESDGSFLVYEPHAGVVTSVEPDHLDHYGSADAVEEAFLGFSKRIAAQGFLVACADDPGARRLADAARGQDFAVHTYGESDDADVRAVGVTLSGATSTFQLVARGRRLGAVALRLPGRYNVLNATAALAAGLELGFPLADLRAGVEAFTGTRRRFELKGVAAGVRVYDDYAHHPTEVRAVLTAARQVAGSGRLIVAFQPHLFSRTRAFAEEFGQALGLADRVVVMDVFAAREDPLPGVTGAAVASAVPPGVQDVAFEPSWSAVAGRLAEHAVAEDLVLTLGAGDVTMIGAEVLSLLRERA